MRVNNALSAALHSSAKVLPLYRCMVPKTLSSSQEPLNSFTISSARVADPGRRTVCELSNSSCTEYSLNVLLLHAMCTHHTQCVECSQVYPMYTIVYDHYYIWSEVYPRCDHCYIWSQVYPSAITVALGLTPIQGVITVTLGL